MKKADSLPEAELLSLLGGARPFKEMPKPLLRQLARQAVLTRLKPGELLYGVGAEEASYEGVSILYKPLAADGFLDAVPSSRSFWLAVVAGPEG